MWAASMKSVSDIPRSFKGLFEWCMADSPRHRPMDAWVVQDKLGSLAKAEYGASKYLPLKLNQLKGI